MRALIALVLVASFAPGALAVWQFHTLQGKEFPLDALFEGKWCLAFVTAPGCSACAAAIGWLERWEEVQTKSEVHMAVVVPWDTPELRDALKAVQFPVIVDDKFILAQHFKVKVAPTVVLFAEGAFVRILKWPFYPKELWKNLSELNAFVIPKPQDLLGGPPPKLSGTDLEGKEISLEALPRPFLLFFFSVTCPACRASLEFMDRFTDLLHVALVILTKGHGLSLKDREELASLAEKYGHRLTIILPEDEGKAMERYRIRWTPTFFLVDVKGNLRAVWEGSSETLIQELVDLLGQNSR